MIKVSRILRAGVYIPISAETENGSAEGYVTDSSTEPALKHTFRDPGVHTVECLASSPNEGSAQGFLRIRYNTTVNPK